MNAINKFFCLFVVCLFCLGTLKAQTCTTSRSGDWDRTNTWSCSGASNFPDGNWNGTNIVLNDDTKIPNNTIIDLSPSSSMTSLVISAGVSLTFGSNAKIKLPPGSSITLENGATVIAANNSSGTLIEIGGNGVWGRGCTGCSNTELTGPGTMDENSNPADPLPVELMFFNANMSTSNVQLHWATASETENSHFVIERASSDLVFSEIGRRTGAGESNVIVNYRFSDNSPLNGTSYYRIVQVDYDGTETTSRALAIHSSFTSAGINVFPNPSNTGTISLEYYHPEVDKLKVTYIDATGRTVYQEEISEPVGERIELGENLNLDKGIYEVRIQLDNLVYVKRLLVN